MSAETWERTLKIFEAKKLLPRQRENELNPSPPNGQQSKKPATNVRIDDSILEEVYNLIPPNSATSLEDIVQDISDSVGIDLNQVVQSVINLEQDGRILVEKGRTGQVFVMKNV
jgi:hypothetical protein